MAKPSFQPFGAVAVKVLARLEARKAVKERMRQQGVKFYKHAELLAQASDNAKVLKSLKFSIQPEVISGSRAY